ncbi:MAG: hypothetical protein MJZ05_04385 [Fibrobacter sp.]|nr:hypothetical protein [Fibrobacter sp.]
MFGKISKVAAVVVPALLLACGETSTSPDATGGNGGDVSSSSNALSSSSDAGTLPEVSSSSVESGSSAALDSALAALSGKLMHWVASEDGSRIETGLDVGTNTSGLWWEYRDDDDGGESTLEWPVELGKGDDSFSKDPVVEYCGGLCGTYNLKGGKYLEGNPYVATFFYVGGYEDEDDDSAAPVDASKWNGICVAYTSDDPMDLEMGLGDVDAEMNYERRSVILPKSESPTTKCFRWRNFSYGAGDRHNGSEFADKLVSLHFKVQGKAGTAGSFNILGLSSNEAGE